VPPPVAATAQELGIELLQAESVNDEAALARIRAVGAPVAGVCAFGQLIREPLLSELPMLNVHPSLLPRWRGAAPIERAIMAGDRRTGVSVMLVTAGLDSGPVALQEEIEIDPRESFGSLSGRLAALGGELLVRAFEHERSGQLDPREQDETRVTYAEKIEAGERRLDPARPADELARRVRALTPHIGAYIEGSDGERLGVREAVAVGTDLAAGRIQAEDGTLLLGCGTGALRLEAVQPPGGRPMPADVFLRGHRPPAAARAEAG
jgi:methionyl-tRNA formyltransferase